MDLTKPKFYKVCININQELTLDDLSSPGIFGVKCRPTKRIMLLEANDSVLFSISIFFDSLLNGSIDNTALFNDFKKYGKEAFDFVVFHADLELENPLKREKFVNYYKILYKEKLY